MNRKFRIGLLILVVGIVLVGAGIYSISRIFTTTLQPLPPPTAVPPITEQVLVLTRDVPIGYLIQESDVIPLAIPVELVPRNIIKDPAEVVGRITKTNLISGEMLLDHHLADPTNIQHDKAYIIGEDMVLMAFPAEDLLSRLEILQTGDVVDLFVTMPYEVKVVKPDDVGVVNADEDADTYVSYLMTFDALQHLRLTAVVVEVFYAEEAQNQPSVAGIGATPAPTPVPTPTDINVLAYLLALDPQDALVLKNLIDGGAIFDFVLRNPLSDQDFPVTPVTLEYLVDRFGLPLEIERQR